MNKDSVIFIAGHTGLVGSAFVRQLSSYGFSNILTVDHQELDLTNSVALEQFFQDHKPEYVIHAAAIVGGIEANRSNPVRFMSENLKMGMNIVSASYKYNVKKLLNLASSCIYPKNVPQPMKEEYLLSDVLEETSEAYSLAKISILKLCNYYNREFGTDFITIMPPNQFGIGDNFNMQTAHFLPMLVRRIYLAKLLQNSDFEAIRNNFKKYPVGWNLDIEIPYANDRKIEEICNKLGAYRNKIVLWGKGDTYRELMNSETTAKIGIEILQNFTKSDIGDFINIGMGFDFKISTIASMIKNILEFDGIIEYDNTKPSGVGRKLLDNGKMKKLGIVAQNDFYQQLESYCKYFIGK